MIASMAEQKEQKGEIDSLRASIDSIKAELGKGEMVWRSRRSGKTTALMEFIHENYKGECFIACRGENMAYHFRRRYRRMYPGDVLPRTLNALGQINVCGQTGSWATDEVYARWLIQQSFTGLEGLDFIGGVGSEITTLSL